MNFEDLTDEQVYYLVCKQSIDIENSLYVSKDVTEKLDIISNEFVGKAITKQNVIAFRNSILTMLDDLIGKGEKESFKDEEGNFVLPKDVTVDISFYSGMSHIQFIRKQ